MKLGHISVAILLTIIYVETCSTESLKNEVSELELTISKKDLEISELQVTISELEYELSMFDISTLTTTRQCIEMLGACLRDNSCFNKQDKNDK